MTRKDVYINIVFLIILCIGLFYRNQNSFIGTKIIKDNVYELNIEKMYKKDVYSMWLEKKDMLHIYFETQKGSLSLEIKNSSQTIYQGNGKSIKEFSLSIPETGLYTFVVKGYGAKGTIEIKK